MHAVMPNATRTAGLQQPLPECLLYSERFDAQDDRTTSEPQGTAFLFAPLFGSGPARRSQGGQTQAELDPILER